MKVYDNYKDSEIEWVGKIPNHWKVKRLKRLAKICGGEDQKEVLSEDGAYPIYGSGGMFGKANRFLHSGPSVLLGRKGTIDKPLYVNTPFWSVDTAFYTDIFPDTNPRYFYYLCTTINFELYKYGSAVPSMSRETLNQIPFVCPNLDEQTILARYLDYKVTHIDKLIIQKEKLIELLNQECSALINQAVTKGIKSNVAMKDTELNWFGEIPVHWTRSSFRFCINILTDYTANGSFASLASNVEYLESGYSRLIRLTDLRLNMSNSGIFVNQNAHEFLKKSELLGGELLIANVGAYAGLTCIMPIFHGKATLGPNMFLLRLNQNIEFFQYLLSSPVCAEQLKMMSVSSAQPKLNKDNIRQLQVIYPSPNEQKEIVSFIKKETKKINLTIAGVKKEVQLLREYKSALISEVVTGKVDVRYEVINEDISVES